MGTIPTQSGTTWDPIHLSECSEILFEKIHHIKDIAARIYDIKGIREEGKNEEEIEEETPAIPRAMDVDADEDYL
ncbi:hypothetical protein PIB30_052423, partial [Stylosanthes scabra]|nr:hypothetical protein [Stylosanthes scabra]